MNWSAADIAKFDQVLASTDAELDVLVTMLRIGTAEQGEQQAMSTVALFIMMRDSPKSMAGLLIAALRRIAMKEESA